VELILLFLFGIAGNIPNLFFLLSAAIFAGLMPHFPDRAIKNRERNTRRNAGREISVKGKIVNTRLFAPGPTAFSLHKIAVNGL